MTISVRSRSGRIGPKIEARDREALQTMRPVLIVAMLMLAACGAREEPDAAAPAPWYPSANADGDPLMAVYESRVPCLDEQGRATPGCEKVKVALVLYRDAASGAPTTYLLGRVYVGDDSGRIETAGRWSIGAGTALDPAARVYELDASAPADFRSYWVVSDDILFILDRDRHPRLGDAGYGYALNRTE